MTDETTPPRESLTQILGGRRGAIDASIPPVVFVIGWLATGRSISWGAIIAIGVAVVLGAYRPRRNRVRNRIRKTDPGHKAAPGEGGGSGGRSLRYPERRG